MNFKNKRGNMINVISDTNCSSPKGIILSVHGIGSHFQPSSYTHQYDNKGRALLFNNAGYLSYAIELEGHGKSEGKRCFIRSFDDLIDDVNQLILNLKDKHHLPIFLIGFSMGGAICIHFLIKKQRNLVNGSILMAPMCGIKESMKPSQPVQYILKFLSYFFPDKPWVPGSDKEFIRKCSPNQDYVESKKDDIYGYKNNHRLATAYSCLDACNFISTNYKKFLFPVLIIHGDNDVVTDFKSSEKFYNNIESPDKQFLPIKNGYHNLLIQGHKNDKNPEIIFNHILSWIEERVNKNNIILNDLREDSYYSKNNLFIFIISGLVLILSIIFFILFRIL
ncbi:Serine aminopeptidase, S33 [seawater metagenome]|uniref:Serine aminopeptidase, S33 n=1 Tax=seawater metagenome TaxID=1561972 RepID=A0A5E8CMI7_9ZZZZ